MTPSARATLQATIEARSPTLQLADEPLGELPDEVLACDWLETLEVPRCELAALPADLGVRLPRLRDLDVSGNQLAALPDSIGELAELRGLYAGANQLGELPDAIGRLTQLRRVHAYANRLRRVPAALAQLWLAPTAGAGELGEGLRLDANPLPGSPLLHALEPVELVAALLAAEAGEPMDAHLARAHVAAAARGRELAARLGSPPAASSPVGALIAAATRANARPTADADAVYALLTPQQDPALAALLAALAAHAPRAARHGAFELIGTPTLRPDGLVVLGHDRAQRAIAFELDSPPYATRFLRLDPEYAERRELVGGLDAIVAAAA